MSNILLLFVQVVEQSLPQIYTFYLNNYLLVLFLFNLSFIMKSSLGEFCFRLLPYYPLGIVTCVYIILILFIISSCRIYEKIKGQIFLIIGFMFGRIKSFFKNNYLLQKNSLHLKNINVDIMPVIRKNYNARAVSTTDS